MQQLHVFIYGRVQRVGFRSFICDEVDKLGITGWVKNVPDGSVEAVLQGEKKLIEQVINTIIKGNGMAKIEKSQSQWEEGNELSEFKILF